jgi:tetratricopeptide (TPR) repeat protein
MFCQKNREQKPVTKSSIAILNQQEATFAKGSKEKSIVDLSSSSAAEVLSMYLRAFKGRRDYASLAIGTDKYSFGLIIENIRNLIYAGNLDAAGIAIQNGFSNLNLNEEEFNEINLEAARIAVRQNRFDESLQILNDILASGVVGDVTRLSALQLKGHCLIESKVYQEAIITLQDALALGQIYNAASSAFSARAFLAIAYCHEKNFVAAQIILQEMEREVSVIKDESLWADRTLTLLRTKIKYCKAMGESQNPERIKLLTEASQIAQWLGDSHCQRQCEEEILECGTEGAHFIDREILNSFSGWIYLPRLQVILTARPLKIERLDTSPVAEKIIKLICRGEQNLDKLFEAVWNLPFDTDRHGTHLRATLSKVRKLLPEGALVVKHGAVNLV